MDFSTTWNDALRLRDLPRGAVATVDARHVSTRQSDGAGNTSNRGLVFLVEILLKRAYVGSRVVCELLLTTAVVTGGLYVY